MTADYLVVILPRMKVHSTFSLNIETVETLRAMSKRTSVSLSGLAERALTMLFNEHAMEVRRAEGGPIWLAPMKPVTAPAPADALTEPAPAPALTPTELPAPPLLPHDQAGAPAPADPHVAPQANGAAPRPAPFFPPRQRNVTLT